MLLAPVIPSKVTSLNTPITPAIELKESIPCPVTTYVVANDFK